MLRFADHTWTLAEYASLVFLHLRKKCVSRVDQFSDASNSTDHLRQTPGGDNISCMYETIEMLSALLYLHSHLIIHLHVEDICDKIERILIVLNFGVEAG